MIFTTFGQVSSFTASSMISRKSAYVSSDNGMVCYGCIFCKAGLAVCVFLLKIWPLTWYFIVNSRVSLTLISVRCFRKNGDVELKMVCLYKCFNYTHPRIFAILYYV